ncbi:hypothetical protein BDR04DRAFT_1109194 [Suillus decipiens]|nr:hypothetical protein BDR04DRAFT_1109194 [Suillus decipiens]
MLRLWDLKTGVVKKMERESQWGVEIVIIDLVFLDYLGSRVIKVLNDLQKEKKYTSEDVEKSKSPYSATRTNEVLGIHARDKWNW